MEMKFEHRIPASREQVWAALNNVEILKASIAGCEVLEATSPTSFNAKITAKVGPVKAKFQFDVTLTDLNPPNSYTINAKGQGGAAGFANGSAAVNLTSDGADTILAYHAQANVGGKLAQLGARLIDGTAKKMADDFFGKFSELAANPEAADGDTTATEQPAATPVSQGVPAWIWLVGGVIVAGIAWAMLF
jgi:carbon monoxide dehydrogenase subunit G